MTLTIRDRHYAQYEPLIARRWFAHAMNTNEISKELRIPEQMVDRIIARLMEERHQGGKPCCT